MAVTHRVCVLVGAPGPWHGGAAMALVVTSEAAPITAGATVLRRYARSFDCLGMKSLPWCFRKMAAPCGLTIGPIVSQYCCGGLIWFPVAMRKGFWHRACPCE